jgi:hypothetical protein
MIQHPLVEQYHKRMEQIRATYPEGQVSFVLAVWRLVDELCSGYGETMTQVIEERNALRTEVRDLREQLNGRR